MIRREFKGKSIIANWGFKKAYIVDDVIFDSDPFDMYFDDSQGEKTSVANYFYKVYKMKVSEKKQPLFVCRMGGKECHLPPEFCTVDGVPASIRADPRKMRDVLQTTRKTPE